MLAYLIRFSFPGLFAGCEVPARLRRALGFMPVTVLPVMVVPMVVHTPEGGWAEPHRILAALATVVVGAATRSLVLSIVTGIAAFWGLRALGL